MSDDMDYITSPLTSPGNIQIAVTNSLPSTVYVYCTVLSISQNNSCLFTCEQDCLSEDLSID